MARYFRLEQAERLLPTVELSIRKALELKQSAQEASDTLESHMRHLKMAGGAFVNYNRLHALKDQRDQSMGALKRLLEEIHELGCQVKDLDIGLLDFPTLYRGEEVLLCWKLGETGISFWHGLTEGFRGRKAIDRDFLDNHRGDLEQ
ncbi:MAG: DUF2203 family protein [Acidobacteria bacterium]|nr:DUF2203 family protein [Acidobacteriota bacterium]